MRGEYGFYHKRSFETIFQIMILLIFFRSFHFHTGLVKVGPENSSICKPFGFHSIWHLTASILYHKGYDLSVIQAILRPKSPTTTNRYLQSVGLENTRLALEQGLKKPAKVIQYPKKMPSEGCL